MNKKFALLGIAGALAAFSLFAFYRSPSDNKPVVVAEATSYSNIHPNDYVGPETCANCHSEHYDCWKSHPHSKMNRNATDETVVGDFSGVTIEYGSGHIVFEKQGERFLMSLYDGSKLSRQYCLTRTVGSRFTQMYIGLQTIGPEPSGHHVYHIEGKLPFGYWINRKLWTPVSYFDSAYEPEPVEGWEKTEMLSHSQRTIKWELNCLYCHNTYPYQHRVFFGEGMGFQPEDFQFPQGGETVAQWGALTPDKLITLGISCESCHFGGREHVVSGHPTRYYPSSPQLIVAGLPDPAHDPTKHTSVINSICTQCHCAKVTLYPSGAATWNSREALDMQSGACQQQIKCTDCHDPHRAGPMGGLSSESQIAATCVGCHQRFRDDATLAQHTRHAAGSVTCLDCHMPRIVQGLDTVIRTHHICSPTDERMLRLAGPNACNLCHLDRSIRWTANQLNRGWGSAIYPDADWSREYGKNLDKPVGKAWLDHSQPVVRLIASDAFARSADQAIAVRNLLPTLKDPYAVNRMFGLFAVERVLGRQLTADEYAPSAAQAERDRMVDFLLEDFVETASH